MGEKLYSQSSINGLAFPAGRLPAHIGKIVAEWPSYTKGNAIQLLVNCLILHILILIGVKSMNRFQIAVLGCWGLLLLAIVGLMFVAEVVGPSVRSALLPVTANALEFVLGAIVGAITTLMANPKFSSPSVSAGGKRE